MIVPAVAVTLPVALPAAIVSVGGTERSVELEAREIMTPVAAGCDRVMAQIVVAADMTPA